MTTPSVTTPRPTAPTILAKTATGRALLFEYGQGEGLPPHTHAGQTVVVAVLGGELQLSVDGASQTVRAGEVRVVKTDGFFSSLALTGGTRVLVTLLSDSDSSHS